MLHGIVVKSTGSWYDVRTDEGALLSCKVKGNFRLRGIRSTNPVAVGDGVSLALNPDGTAYITAIDDRRNFIVRKASNLSRQSQVLAANIDMALLVATVARPETSTTFIDRFLATAEAYGVETAIAFNKTDDLSAGERDELGYLQALYRHVGYTCFAVSALTGEGMDGLRQALSGRLTLLAGNSGVGKSTLLNLLVPSANARTAAISRQHRTGTHTTTHSELYPLPGDPRGGLIDIPGIKGFGTFTLRREEMSHFFRDIFAIGRACRYRGCTHTHEPQCAVLAALEEGRLAPSRYASYLSMLDDIGESKYREKL